MTKQSITTYLIALLLTGFGISLFGALTTPAIAQDSPVENAVTEAAESVSLEKLLELARDNNPTLKQAVALIEGEEGKAKQAGLWPNPTLNYIGEQITEDGTAGEFQGGSIRQRIVTGGKLALSRQKYEARVDVARRNLLAQEFRVRNDVETSYYESLGAQAKLKLYEDLLNIAKDHYQTTVELVNIGNLSRADLEKAGVMLQKARLDRFMAENEQKSRRLSLEAVVGVPLESATLAGSLESEVEVLPDWEPLLARTVAESPQVLAALDKLRSDEITVRRERVEPIPDIVLEAGAGHNFIADQTGVYGRSVR